MRWSSADQLRVGEAGGGALADGAQERRAASSDGRPRAGSNPKCSRPSSRSPSRSGTTTHQRMPVAAIARGVLGVGGDALDQVQRELGDVRLAVRERGRAAGRGASARGRSEASQRDWLLGPDDPAGEALRMAAAVDHVDRAGVGELGDEQVDERLDALPRPGALRGARDRLEQRGFSTVSRAIRAGPAHAGRGEGHRELGAAAGRLAQVHERGQRGRSSAGRGRAPASRRAAASRARCR